MRVDRVKKSGEIESTSTHFQITRLLELVKAIQVRQPKTSVIGQCDGNGVLSRIEAARRLPTSGIRR
jgi:hypothetical protein